jgi:hypothetical protein
VTMALDQIEIGGTRVSQNGGAFHSA